MLSHLILVFIQHVFIEHLLYAQHCPLSKDQLGSLKTVPHTRHQSILPSHLCG